MKYVSAEPICGGVGFILRHHPNGGGFGAEWDFVAILDGNTIKAGWGEFSLLTFRRLVVAMRDFGFYDVVWQHNGRRHSAAFQLERTQA